MTSDQTKEKEDERTKKREGKGGRREKEHRHMWRGGVPS